MLCGQELGPRSSRPSRTPCSDSARSSRRERKPSTPEAVVERDCDDAARRERSTVVEGECLRARSRSRHQARRPAPVADPCRSRRAPDVHPEVLLVSGYGLRYVCSSGTPSQRTTRGWRTSARSRRVPREGRGGQRVRPDRWRLGGRRERRRRQPVPRSGTMRPSAGAPGRDAAGSARSRGWAAGPARQPRPTTVRG